MGGGMTDPALLTQGLCKNFGALRVTNNLDLRIEAGARHALIGPNGAGKSTLVNLLTGVLKPTSGQGFLNSADIARLPAAERVWKGFSRTFQCHTLYPHLTDAYSPSPPRAYRCRLARRAWRCETALRSAVPRGSLGEGGDW